MPFRRLLEVAALALLGALPAAQSPAWEVGRPLPSLALPTIDRSETVALDDLRGRRLLLIEFASW